MLKSTFRTILSKLSIPLWLAVLLSAAVPVLAAQQHRATSRFNAIGPSQVNGAIVISRSSLTISEPNGSDTFNVSLDADPAASVSIPLSVSSTECTLSDSIVILDSTNWEAGETVTVTAVDDPIDDGAQSCDVQFGASDSTNGDYDGLTHPDLPVTVNDDDTAAVQVSPTSFTITEGASDSFDISLTSQPTSDVTINLTPNAECTVNPTSVTFTSGDWQTAQSVDVTGVEDGVVDGTQQCLVTTSKTTGDPSYNTVTVDDVTVTVLDGDLPTVQFSSNTYNVDEDAGTATITVELSAPAAGDVTVTAATSDGTAEAGSDYEAVNELVTIPTGQESATFDVTIIDDPTDEDIETVSLALSNPTGPATLGTPSSATLTITDNDLEPNVRFSTDNYPVNEGDGSRMITVQLSEASGREVTVDYTTGDGTATTGEDYTTTAGTLRFVPGDTSETFTVPIIDDNVFERFDESINLALSGANNATIGSPGTARILIRDNDTKANVQFSRSNYDVNEGDDFATISVVLSRPVGELVSINYATSDGTATAGADYTARNNTLTFPSGVITRTFTVPITDDLIDENNETVNLSLSSPQPSAALNLGPRSSSILNIIDNDGATEIQFASATYSVTESAGTATINVVRSGLSAFEVRVNYATTGGSATAGQDYTATSGTLVFGPNETSKSFEVPIIADGINEPPETVNLALSNPVLATLGSPSTAVLTIHDSNEAPAVQFSQDTYTVDESMLTANITVTLNVPKTEDVTVFYAVQEGTATLGEDFATTGVTLTIPAGQTAGSFSVTLLPDQIDEPDETVILTLTGAEGAELGQRSTATLIIVDNDPTPTISFSLSSLTVGETDGTADLPVRLSAESGRTVTVDYTTVDGSAVAGSDYIATSGTLTFAPGDTTKTIHVPLLEGLGGEPNEIFFVELSAPVNATLSTPDRAIVTIVDGDLVRYTRFFPLTSYFSLGEPNDTCSDAYEILPFQTYLFAPDDVFDWYYFTITEPGNLIVDVNNFVPTSGQIVVGKGTSCADAKYLVQIGVPDIDNHVELEDQEPGLYYIIVTNDGAPTFEPYELRVRLVPQSE